MDEKKFGKYIVTELKIPEGYGGDQGVPDDSRARLLFMDNSTVEGAFYLSAAWYLKDSDTRTPRQPTLMSMTRSSRSSADNPDDVHDLGGELEIWLGGEQHFVTKSCLIFVPSGLSHCPFWVRKMKHPILHFTTAPMGAYTKKET